MPYVGNQPTSVAFLTDTFNGNGSTTAFTLSAAPATSSSILVAISGVLQDPSTYSTTGTTLNFSAAPPSGTGNISVRFLGIPASGVVTTAYRTQTEFTATAGQTTFSVPSYTVGYIDVYRNGVLLGSADFTATNGTTVVLAAGASAGDLIETVSFYVSSVLNAVPTTGGTFSGNVLFGSGNGIWNTSGNVGVGTSSPSGRMTVSETNRTLDGIGNFNVFTTNSQAANFGGQIALGGVNGSAGVFDPWSFATIKGAKENSTSGNFAGYFAIATPTSGGTLLERMRIDSSGNVGIGGTPYAWATVAPGLDVGSTGGIASFTNQAVFAYNLYYNGSNFVYKTSSQGAQYRLVNGAHYWETAPSGTASATVVPSLRMVLDNNGNLGIGNSPNTVNRLQVTGADSTSGSQSLYCTNSNGTAQLFLRNDNYFNSGAIANYSVAGTALVMDSGNYVGKTTSSLRYKKDIVDYDKGLDAIAKLRPVYYKSAVEGPNGIDPKQHAGFIAEEIDAEGFEEFLVRNQEGEPDAVQYAQMTALLCKAIQELNDKVEAQAAEIQALKGATQ